jgi:26S proteasome non-ATPase regulatory subunit 10
MMASSIKDADALVDLLLSKSADVDEKTNNGQTALHFTASKSNLDTAKKLIAHKASARVKDKRGQLPLHRAAAVGNVLHHAIAEGHGALAVALLKAGAEPDKRDNSDKLAIELAPDAKVRDYVIKYADEEGIEMRPK